MKPRGQGKMKPRIKGRKFIFSRKKVEREKEKVTDEVRTL